jgi:endonuclease YncB( thermonuclease family)
MKSFSLASIALIAMANACAAQTPVAQSPQAKNSPWFAIPADVVYETGDTWSVGDIRYRLYGVQSCLRGTSFTNAAGVNRDCGEASLAVLVSLVRDLKPQCFVAASSPDRKTSFVFCFAMIAQGASAGARIDLGTALISMGYGFASIKADNQPVHMPYYVAQIVARQAHRGLWAFADVKDPNVAILRSLRATQAALTSPSPAGPGAPVSRGSNQ